VRQHGVLTDPGNLVVVCTFLIAVVDPKGVTLIWRPPGIWRIMSLDSLSDGFKVNLYF